MNILEKYTPNDLQLTRYWNIFGNSETETSAYWVVWFLQERGDGWEPFTHQEIEDFYNQKRVESGRTPEIFLFNHLLLGDHFHLTAKNFMGGIPEYRPNPGGIRVIGGAGRNKRYVVEPSFVEALISKGYRHPGNGR